MLIKDWEYLEDKLSMGHMALFTIILIIHLPIYITIQYITVEAKIANQDNYAPSRCPGFER